MQTLRILHPHPGIIAFYDGRVKGYRFDPCTNWVDDGALSLGIASYALVHGDAAVVYDTGTTLAHGQAIAAHLAGLGITDIRVVLSHWHKDHVAGTAAFGGVPVLANALTAAHLAARRAEIEAGIDWPPIIPLIQPSQTFAGQTTLTLGPQTLVLIHLNIHSDDATVIWLPDQRILLAGDTLEDPVTYVAEPEHFATHLRDLDRLSALGPLHILPCHGDPDVIAAGGYGPALIPATQHYIRALMTTPDMPVGDILAPYADTLHWYAPYAAVHAANIKAANIKAATHG
jgi:cyclase